MRVLESRLCALRWMASDREGTSGETGREDSVEFGAGGGVLGRDTCDIAANAAACVAAAIAAACVAAAVDAAE